MVSVTKLLPKICGKFSAEILVKRYSIFCAINFMLMPFVRLTKWLVKWTPVLCAVHLSDNLNHK
jgi:hypothetical protein